jgi:transposase
MNDSGFVRNNVRVKNDRATLRAFLESLPPGTPIALETTGSWYWFADEIEESGHVVHLTHARKAKLMMGQINKTDKLDASGLALLLRNGTLPVVWIPPRELRDQRALLRTRMSLVRIRTRIKNRIHATFSQYGIRIEEVSDIFGVSGRGHVSERAAELPPETRRSMDHSLTLLDQVQSHIDSIESRLHEILADTEDMRLLMTMPGVGKILASVIALEVGDVYRFPGPSHLASYCGLVPRVNASGGKVYFGRVRPDVNRSLKWAYVEAANVVSVNHTRWGDSRHVARQYRKVRTRKGHHKAVVAVARHLSEATYWMLRRREPYRERNDIMASSSHG